MSRRNCSQFHRVVLGLYLFVVALSPPRGGIAVFSLSLVRIGTRPSPLALKQAQSVADLLKESHPAVKTEFIVLESSSEHKTGEAATQAKPLAMAKVDFTSTIDKAVVRGDVDIGVHSFKDIPPDHKWHDKESLTIACYLPRACPLDVLIGSTSIQSLKPGARVGSSSTRRQSQLLSLRPDLELMNVRGNVQTRLKHLQNGLVDALVMARAGLDRLGCNDVDTTVLSANEILPAPGQGIIGVVCRRDDTRMIQILQSIDNVDSRVAATAERQVLNTVDVNVAKPYSGRPPLSAFVEQQGGKLLLRARLARPDGTVVVEVERSAARDCKPEEARLLGEDAGFELVQLAGPHFFDYESCHEIKKVVLRNATLDDLDVLLAWEKMDHIQASLGDYDFNDWNWKEELPRSPPWRHQLIATTLNGTSIGFIQVIDPKEEETHYWGNDCPPNLRAIDIWIGERDYLRKGFGTQMLKAAIRDYCFSDESVEAILVDPMERNTDAHRFYQRCGFRPVGTRQFGPDKCLVHRLDRKDWQAL